MEPTDPAAPTETSPLKWFLIAALPVAILCGLAARSERRAAAIRAANEAAPAEDLKSLRAPDFTPAMEALIGKGRSHLKSLARLQLAYRSRHGRWAADMDELSAVVKSSEAFKARLSAVFPEGDIRCEVEGLVLSMRGRVTGARDFGLLISGTPEGFLLPELEFGGKRFEPENVEGAKASGAESRTQQPD